MMVKNKPLFIKTVGTVITIIGIIIILENKQEKL